jgi:OHCU decarboxylase
LKISQFNEADPEFCVRTLDGIFEHSAWIAREAVKARPFATWDELFQTMEKIVRTASSPQQEALIQAHPRLGGAGKLTKPSGEEQRQAGLNRLEEKEAAQLAAWNAEYERRFNFPFIFAVRGRSRQEIFTALKARLGNDRQKECAQAIEEIIKIARFRFEDLLEDNKS